MATDQSDNGDRSGFDRLMSEASDYLASQAGHLADKAVDKLGDLTDGLYDVAENGGKLGDLGGRLLQGDSPAKAVLGQTFGGIKDKVKDVGSGLLGGKKKKNRKGGGKSMNIVESIDVGVPLRTAYDHWTQYENFSSFAKGVRSVSQGDETTTDWKVKVGPSTRSWKASVQEQIPDDRIVWTSEGPKGTTRGCVSFHELAPSLTRILLVVEYYPAGLFEKTGNLWRAQGRRMRLDLKHFDRFVSLSNEEPDGWRGEIEGGEVVVTHEDAVAEEESENDDEGEGEGEGANEDAEAEEPAEGDQEDEEDQDDLEDQEGQEDEEDQEDQEDQEEAYPDEEEDEYEEDSYEDEDEDDAEEDAEDEAPQLAGRRR
ncbi:SRPBCC family protein [Streptomyces sp. LMG1-1-1.1]|uniref:SRPBCC family protein n=1 Tax=Streptomyces sp. LMG1-1-1.1 TaxID=3135245 RepID=UPI003465E72D